VGAKTGKDRQKYGNEGNEVGRVLSDEGMLLISSTTYSCFCPFLFPLSLLPLHTPYTPSLPNTLTHIMHSSHFGKLVDETGASMSAHLRKIARGELSAIEFEEQLIRSRSASMASDFSDEIKE